METLSREQKRRTFIWACRHGDICAVRALLALRDDHVVGVHARCEFAFRRASRFGHVCVVRELLGLAGDRAVCVHTKKEKAFRWACRKGHLDVMRELLALVGHRRNDVHVLEEEAFRWACRKGHLDVMRELLALRGGRAVDVHARHDEALGWAVAKKKRAAVDELLSLTGEQAPAPHLVKYFGLQQNRRDVLWSGVNPLRRACQYGRGRRAMVCFRRAYRASRRAARSVNLCVETTVLRHAREGGLQWPRHGDTGKWVSLALFVHPYTPQTPQTTTSL